MRIGISYWGFCESFESSKEAKTPDGHRYGRPIFVDALNERGHNVVSLQQRRETTPYVGLEYNSGFPEIDILFLEWRWPTYKNSGTSKFEPDLDRQEELLNHYHGKIPVVIWDCDYKVTPEDERKWPLARIADPALNPRFLTRSRDRLMFWTDWKPLLDPSQGSCEYGYVGNNYERDNAFDNYYSRASSLLRGIGIQTTVHGNWLERSPERASPENLIWKHPNIAFAPRLNFYESMKRLNSFICTTHITKPEYAERGFVSPRYVENLAAGVPALTPFEFCENALLGADWTVKAHDEVFDKVSSIRGMNDRQRIELVDQQRYELMSRGVFGLSEVVSYFESLI